MTPYTFSVILQHFVILKFHQVTAGKIQLWSPSSDGLCAGSTLTPVHYGEDAFSGCLVRLSFDDISNCSLLRETILTHQASLIQATHVGRSGNADLDVPDDWLPVIRLDDQ